MPALIALCTVCLSFATPLILQDQASAQAEGPPLKPQRIVAEVMSGLGSGIVPAIGLGLAGDRIMGTQDAEDSGHTGFYIGWFAGWTIGSSLGVYIAGDTDNETGSYRAAFLGSAVGAGIGRLLWGPALDSPLLLLGSLFVPPVAGTIAFNKTRRYKTSHDSGAGLINIRDGHLRLAIPAISFHSSSIARKDHMHANLMDVRF